MKELELENAQVTVLLEISGQIHLVAMTQERMDLITNLTKAAAEIAVPTSKTQDQLNIFLGYNG